MTIVNVTHSDTDSHRLQSLYSQIRRDSVDISEPLAIEDYGIQTMPDVSPTKWHLAHTTWFFETFVLKPFSPGYHPFHASYEYLFNSYYEQIGSFHPRPERGLLSRPTVEEVYQYRYYVDQAMQALLNSTQLSSDAEIGRRTMIGLQHEQQHQELMLTDIKHIFAYNPLKPMYKSLPLLKSMVPAALQWHEQPEGIYRIGDNGEDYFTYDNESPQHKVYIAPFRIASRLVINAEYLEFIAAGGYQQPQHWLSDGWKTVNTEQWQSPLYWSRIEGEWYEMTLGGLRPLDLAAPVCHVSLYEAHAYASWRQKRLPTEQEWEIIARDLPVHGNLRESGYLQPIASDQPGMIQFFGDVWEWTMSSYSPYPGYHPAAGALGEYNGKFMSSQMVLRGGSCVTPKNHIRASYRNFFYPRDRWQFSGIRLAESL